MKMLIRDGDKQYLISLKERLEENGIPAVIQGEDTARMTIPAFLLEPTLWVYLDEQFEDAVQLINNPDYQVTSAIDVEAKDVKASVQTRWTIIVEVIVAPSISRLLLDS